MATRRKIPKGPEHFEYRKFQAEALCQSTIETLDFAFYIDITPTFSDLFLYVFRFVSEHCLRSTLHGLFHYFKQVYFGVHKHFLSINLTLTFMVCCCGHFRQYIWQNQQILKSKRKLFTQS